MVVWISGRAGMVIGEFGRDRLANDDRPAGAQPCYHARITARPPAPRKRRSQLRGIISGIDDVLDCDGNTVERLTRAALGAALIERARLSDRVLAIEMGKGFDPAVNRVNAIKKSERILVVRKR